MDITPEQLAAHHWWLYNQEGGQRLDLRGADLRAADLRAADLRGADLRGAVLRDANLRAADLRDADLRDADLRDADLRAADLRDADLRAADLRAADLRDANLRDANLRDANLRDANLERTCVRLILADDGRRWQVVAHRGLTSDGEPLYLSGCRRLNAAGAERHWGNPAHRNPEAAARILAAIRSHNAELGANTP